MRITDIFVIISAIYFTIVGAMLLPLTAYTTIDDGRNLHQYLTRGGYHHSGQNVLGAHTKDQVGCPSHRPIIGWVDFKGNKTLPDVLPPGQEPSICFRSLEEAHAEGFLRM